MSNHPGQAPFEIRMLSQPRYLGVVRAVVTALARQIELDEEQAGRVVMAVDEALTNVIRHGYAEQPDRPISVKLAPVQSDGRAGLRVVIEDECDGVDPSKIRGRPLEEVRPGGLGVHIIHEAMDEVRFDRRDDKPGIRLTMTKYATPAEPVKKGP